MLTQIMQIDEQLRALFSEQADPEPEDIHTLLSERQQMLEKILPDLSEENKKKLHLLTDSLLFCAQKARARYALTLFQHKRTQKGVKAYQAVSLQ
ncbi:MAG: hypothetical protein ACRDDD_04460 [Plesiomonas sp.]|uniref:hypothetical protein n=1 Tax=Plesiomonas sp. TaxID=2486279 RepID=UPI003EE5669A